MIYLRLFNESIKFALHALAVNRLRTVLSLLGVTIGIFAIIAVFTVVDSLERNVRDDLNELGDNVVYIQKWPWGGGGGEYEWWEYMKRPEVKYEELEVVQKQTPSLFAATFGASQSVTVKYEGNSIERAGVFGVSEDYDVMWDFDLTEGRYFTDIEFRTGRNFAMIGAHIAEKFFPGGGGIGQEIRVLGQKLYVIGVFEEQGSNTFGNSPDGLVVVPINFLSKFIDRDRSNPMIMAKAKPDVAADQLKDELRGVMRNVRRLKPKAKDNFQLNEISAISAGIEGLFDIIGAAGAIIGGFSILVGGFGIANIMFVSVKERTNQIGIQKALGAKNSFIMLQFLFESVILCVLGGGVGLLLVFGGATAVRMAADFNIAMSMGNVITGVGISALIGVISGFIPAYTASRLDPVEAIRTGM